MERRTRRGPKVVRETAVPTRATRNGIRYRLSITLTTVERVSHTVTTHDPFGRAVRDHHRGERTAPLLDRDGEATREHAIEEWYFGDHDGDAWRDA
jgi:hypothetical protein